MKFKKDAGAIYGETAHLYDHLPRYIDRADREFYIAEGKAAGNVIVGGVIGLGVDAATGAMNKYADRTTIVMIPVQGCHA